MFKPLILTLGVLALSPVAIAKEAKGMKPTMTKPAPRNPTSERTIKCSVDNMAGDGMIDVNLVDQNSSQAVGKGEFKGHRVAVSWFKGTPQESQTSLAMSLDGFTSTMYDIKLEHQVGPLNVLTFGNVRFQCWSPRD